MSRSLRSTSTSGIISTSGSSSAKYPALAAVERLSREQQLRILAEEAQRELRRPAADIFTPRERLSREEESQMIRR
jgi:hypothetical protein